MKKGFTLMEILLAIGIISLISLVVIPSFLRLSRAQALEAMANNIVSILKEAKSKTLSSDNSSHFGVHFESDKTVLFMGETYSSFDSNNVVAINSKFVETSGIILNGDGVDIVFERLTGKTNNYGTVIIRLKSNNSELKTITVSNSGLITSQ